MPDVFPNAKAFPHSPVIYGRRVETFGPYSQDYMRKLNINDSLFTILS
jgi:hypothetical protein